MIRVVSAQIRPGMTLAEHIYNEAGVVQLHAGTVLNESAAARLAEAGCGAIAVEDSRAEDVAVVHSIPREVMTRGRGLLREFREHVRAAGVAESVRVPFDDLLDLVRAIEESLEAAGQNTIEVSPLTMADEFDYIVPVNAATVSMFVAAKAGLVRRTHDVGLGALLCNIGTALTDDPAKHPEMSLKVLRQDQRFSAYSKAIVYQHEERHDGSGYPRGLAGNDVEPLARIVAVADMYCSLIAEGNQMGQRLSPQEAFDFVTSAAGFEFERTTVLGVMQYVAPYPVGTMVRLNTGERGVVTRVYKGLTTRPTLRVLYDANDAEAAQPYDVVLAAPENQTVLVAQACDL